MKRRPASPARSWHVKPGSGGFEVYDPEGRFRGRHPTQAAAAAYVAEHAAARRRPAYPVEALEAQP